MSVKTSTPTIELLDPWPKATHPSDRPQPPALEASPGFWHRLHKQARPVVGGAALALLASRPDATRATAAHLAHRLWDQIRAVPFDAEGTTIEAPLSVMEIGSPILALTDLFLKLILLRDSLSELQRHHASLGAMVKRLEAMVGGPRS